MHDLGVIIAFGLGLVALVAAALAFYQQHRLGQRFDALFAGLDTRGDLAETLEHYFTSVKATENQLRALSKNYQHLGAIAAASMQKTAIVRFNPFKHTGGDQSFVLALLDNHDSGFLLTSIHSREGTRTYIKPIRHANCEHALSREEKSALAAAQGIKVKK